MNLKRTLSGGRSLRDSVPDAHTTPQNPGSHAHFWDRALSRRTFITSAAGATGLVMAPSSFTNPVMAQPLGKTCSPSPNPIPGSGAGAPPHFFFPALDTEISTITDFMGTVGVAALSGTGTGTDSKGVTSRLVFMTDMRFMDGIYIGQDGRRHRGTFAFV